MPGYLLVQMALDEQTWDLVREVPGIYGFAGQGRGASPLPLTEDEAEKLQQLVEDSKEIPKPKITFQVGDRVKVIDGPFLNFSGTVSNINMDRLRLTVMIEMLGRATPVELDFLQVERQVTS
jgi:transcriptional antiterminator NusG